MRIQSSITGECVKRTTFDCAGTAEDVSQKDRRVQRRCGQHCCGCGLVFRQQLSLQSIDAPQRCRALEATQTRSWYGKFIRNRQSARGVLSPFCLVRTSAKTTQCALFLSASAPPSQHHATANHLLQYPKKFDLCDGRRNSNPSRINRSLLAESSILILSRLDWRTTMMRGTANSLRSVMLLNEVSPQSVTSQRHE